MGKRAKRSLAAKRGWETRRNQAAAAAKAASKRSKAAKQGWVTRRRSRELAAGVALLHKGKTFQLLSEELKIKEQTIAILQKFIKEKIEPWEKLTHLDNLPVRMVHETKEEHATRIVAQILKEGIYHVSESYKDVADATGMRPGEVYSLFLALGYVDMTG